MAESSKKDASAAGTPVSASPKPQLLRVYTIIKNNGISGLIASAVMTANRLKLSSRIEPAKFLKMVEQFRNRKIKTIGRR